MKPQWASSAAFSLTPWHFYHGLGCAPLLILAFELTLVAYWCLVASFWEGLAGNIKNELAVCDLPASLNDPISLSNWICITLQERQWKINVCWVSQVLHTFQRPLHTSACVTHHELMQGKTLNLLVEKLHCRQINNFLQDCLVKSIHKLVDDISKI